MRPWSGLSSQPPMRRWRGARRGGMCSMSVWRMLANRAAFVITSLAHAFGNLVQ